MVFLRLSLAVLGSSTVGKTSLLTVFHKLKSFPKPYNRTTGCDIIVRQVKMDQVNDKLGNRLGIKMDDNPSPPTDEKDPSVPTVSPDTVEVYFHDISGSPMYLPFRPQYLADCPYIMAVYDVSNRDSFVTANEWVGREVREREKGARGKEEHKDLVGINTNNNKDNKDTKKSDSKDSKKSPSPPRFHGVLIGNKSDLRDSAEVSEEEAVEAAERNGLVHFTCSALSGIDVEIPVYYMVKNYMEYYKKQVEVMKEGE